MLSLSLSFSFVRKKRAFFPLRVKPIQPCKAGHEPSLLFLVSPLPVILQGHRMVLILIAGGWPLFFHQNWLMWPVW